VTASRVRIAIRDLEKTFVEDAREVRAVAGVSLDVRDGEFVALVGPSGCGKSTVLNMIGGLVRPSAGAVLIDDALVGDAAPGQVGYVFQKDTVTVVFVTHDLSEAITLADRVVVMTRRPGRIKLVHEVKLARPRDVIALRESDEYAREYGGLWHVLGEELA
jgi:ABC-type nitrate/sulfonate/bicarbonate transport system ATPase subunit